MYLERSGADTWNDIAVGGSQRWKVTDPSAHKVALSHMHRYFKNNEINSILCPLAGDDPMAHLLWQQGHSVTAIDLVPLALERMRQQFDGEWSKEEDGRDDGMVVWKHDSGRATQYQGDALKYLPELKESFDAIYDKDSFGALGVEMRQAYCKRISEYTKKNAFVYLECKLKENHNAVKDNGPPFSLKMEDLVEWFGGSFDHAESLGSVYPLSMPTAQQTAHILKRK